MSFWGVEGAREGRMPEAQSAAEREAIGFVLALSRALHAYGAPAYRLEEIVTEVAPSLGVAGQFFSSPTALFASFGPPEDQRTALLRVEPGEMNLEKLSLLHNVTDAVLAGRMTPARGTEWVRDIVARPRRYRAALVVIAFALSSAATARYLNGGLREIGVAAVAGLMTGLLAMLARRVSWVHRTLEPLAALGATAVAGGAVALGWRHATSISALAGLIVLLPGLTLTIALEELSSRHLVSGTARIAGALMTFLQIAFGLAIGARLLDLFPALAHSARALHLPGWTEWAALAVSPCALLVLFQARPRDLPWLVLGSTVAFATARAVGPRLGAQLGMFVSALVLGLTAQVFARWRRRPAALLQVPGVIVLVPGSVGIRSVFSMLEADIVSGMQFAFSLVVLSAALAAGLLVANALAAPRRVAREAASR